MSQQNTQFKMTVQQNETSYELGRRLAQGPRKVPSHSGPCDKSARMTQLNILQLNIEGLQHKVTELMKMLDDYNIHVALLQETLLPKHNINTPGYTPTKCECTNCRGIMTLVRNDVQAEVKNTPIEDIDVQKIDAWLDKKKYTIYNFYCPPKSTSDIPLEETIYKKSIIAGDFNAHMPSLGYNYYNKRGKDLEEICNSTNLILEQDMESQPTLLHKAHGTTSRPDLTFVSADIFEDTSVQVLDGIGSDHRPTMISTNIKSTKDGKTSRRTFWNFRKADWTAYAKKIDEEMENIDVLTPKVEDVYGKISSAILKTAKKTIPQGNHRKFKPFWNKDLDDAVKSREKARKILEKNRTQANKTNYNRLTAKVRLLTKKSKRNHWKKTCQQLDLNKQGHKAWKLLKNLEGQSKKENPKPISLAGKKIVDGGKKAEAFNKHISNVSKSTRRTNLDKALWKQFKLHEKSPTCNDLPFEQDFSLQELEKSIRRAPQKKAPGPDKITNEMIAHLGKVAKTKLLSFINRTWRESKLPTQWRTAKITPILKKGKPAGLPSSYRPISLTSCLGKIAERMVNSRLYYWLEKNKLLTNTQAGFRRQSRTEDQLFRLAQNVIDGFQDSKSTTAVFIDLQQAYDRIWRKGLLIKMKKMGIHGKMLKWIQAFLTNRTIQTTLNGETSSKLTMEEGLPQGSSLSCTLFLIFINDLPELLKTEKALFADDLVIWTTDKYSRLAQNKLNRALRLISIFCNFWKLKINLQKSVYTIFSRSPNVGRQSLELIVDDTTLEKDENPTYLGVQLDRQLNLNRFMSNLKTKASKRLNLIKRLATTSWGASKKTLRQLYLGYVRSAMDYALPLQTIASKAPTEALDRVQNQAVKLICGGMRSTPIAACEIEANIEPLDLRRKRAVLDGVERYKRFELDHPNRVLVDSWRPNKRLQQNSPMDIANKLEEFHHLPQDRLQLKKYVDIPPWTAIRNPTIKTSLLDPAVNKTTEANILKSCALETIDSYPSSSIHAYTDGSAFKGTTFAGFGAYLTFPDGTSLKHCDACGVNCSNFDAEIIAITSAIKIVHQSFEDRERDPCDLVIFTDSKSTLQALMDVSGSNDTNIVHLANTINSLLASFNINITLQWIPGHSGIRGNDIADHLAKSGTQNEHPEKPCSMRTISQMLKNNFKEEWLHRWDTGNTGRAMYAEMTKPNLSDAINNLNRQDQCTIFQFRTGHCKLNYHINRFNPEHPPLCRNCPSPYESVHHVLFDCQALQEIRNKLLPRNPTINNTLYGNTEQLRKTCNFVKLSFTYKS